MRHFVLSFTLFFLTAFLLAQNNKNVLFIGNSITYFNNMPYTFEAIANSKGDITSVTMYAPGGTGFVHHVNDPNVYAKFREKTWDFVVLQPGSGESYGSSSPIATTLNRALQLKDSILKYSPCAKILYYEISNGVTGTSQQDLNNYNNSMDVIRQNLEFLADGSHLYFAPVGEAFRQKWNNDQTDLLWNSYNDIHPNAKGSYIAACVFYATIYQKPSLGTTEISSLSQADATAIQNLVDIKVLDHKPDWRINTWNLYTDFDFQVNGNQVTFNNLSQNADSVLWDFGNGNSSNLDNPVHTYNSIGDFTVSLTTYKSNCSETVSKTLTISSLSNPEFDDKEITLYPNPTEQYFVIYHKNFVNFKLNIYDATGKLILTSNNRKVDISKFKKGIYVVKIINQESNQILFKKLIKN